MQNVLDVMMVQVDENGRITLPQFARERLHLKTGTTLIVEATENAELHLRVLPESAALVNEEGTEEGIQVIGGEPVGDIEGTIEREREARLASFFGGSEAR